MDSRITYYIDFIKTITTMAFFIIISVAIAIFTGATPEQWEQFVKDITHDED